MIKVEGLTKRYARTVAVDNISFEVEKGQIVGFLGPNGAGKTTTMRVLTCFLPPTEGTANIAGFDVLEHPMQVKKRIGYLPGDIIGPREAFRYRRAREYFDVTWLPTPRGSWPRFQLKVPPGFYVVLGDNRAVSDDSRSFGPVAAGDIIGRVVNAPPQSGP